MSVLTHWLGREEAAREASDLRVLADLLTGARTLDTLAATQLQRVQPAAERHGVLGLLPGAPERWANEVRALRVRSLRALRFTRRAVEAVENAGIACVVLKGGAAAARWKEPWARQQSDLDLLVAPSNLGAASRALIDSELASHQQMAGEHMHNAALLPKAPSGLMIELHHALSSGHEVHVDVEALLARRIELESGQGLVPALCPEDDAAYLSMHAATHALARLAWLVDLEALGRAGVDWVEAARRASAWNVALPVECAWREARTLLAVPIPEEAFAALGTSRAQRTVISALYQATWATAGTPHTWIERLFRLSLVPPHSWPARAVHMIRARREAEAAFGAKTTGAAG